MNGTLKLTLDGTIELADNAMLKIRLSLFDEWDFEKNGELGLDVYEVTFGSDKIAWWNCPDCESNYDMTISHRSGKHKSNCPYCRGMRVNHTNSLAALKPILSEEWHPTKNGKLTPHEVTCKKGVKAWWLGKCGHEWEAIIGDRSNGGGCPYCKGNHRVLKGHNDMWTTNPELAKLLANPEDGHRYKQSSGARLDWKCSDCENIIKNKVIASINYDGLRCPNCSDGKSIPEKLVYSILKQLKIEFEWERDFIWSEKKRYDFYLPIYNLLIEVHGINHYNGRFKSIGGKTLKEEQENDRIKESLAKKNGMTYVVIDAREPRVEYIKSSLHKSELMSIFDFSEIDWFKVKSDSLKSIAISASNLFKEGFDLDKIAKELKIDRATVRSYLKKCTELGLCSYSSETRKEIVQLDLETNSMIKVWLGVNNAQKTLSISHISDCCQGKRNFAGGYKWMYKEEYDKLNYRKMK